MSNADAGRTISRYCAELFRAEDARLDVLKHPVQSTAAIAPHAHADSLQLTWLRHCGGRILSGNEWFSVAGTTAAVAYPGERHGYELRRDGPNAEIVLVKLPVSAASILRTERPLPHVSTTLPPLPSLESAIDRLHLDVTPTDAAMPRWIADAAAVLTRWPRSTSGGVSHLREIHGAHADPSVEAAVSLIEERISDPPSLDELARAAKLSSRQLSRRFEQAFGVTPHQYMNERRVARARVLLFDDRLTGKAVAEMLGFPSHTVFSRWFRKREGRTPGQFREDPTHF
ncbi:MAG: AraC family transcriptional regulator [Planctomycetota bacterium]